MWEQVLARGDTSYVVTEAGQHWTRSGSKAE